MAYFPNGTSGMIFEEEWCNRCHNQGDERDESGCAVMDLHSLWNYEQGSEDKHGVTKKAALENFIPTREDNFPGKCRMFRAIEADKDGPAYRMAVEMQEDKP